MSWSLHAADLFSTRLIILPLSGLVLLTAGFVRGVPLWPERSMWGPLAVTGLFNMGLFQIFLISGIALLGPSRTPIIIYTMPAWSSLFAAFMLKERITAQGRAVAGSQPRGRRADHQPGDGGAAGADRHPADPARRHFLRLRHRAHQALFA